MPKKAGMQKKSSRIDWNREMEKETSPGIFGDETVQVLYLLRRTADRTSVFYRIQEVDRRKSNLQRYGIDRD